MWHIINNKDILEKKSVGAGRNVDWPVNRELRRRPRTPGAPPTECHEGHGRMPSPSPQNTCGLIGQTPMNPRGSGTDKEAPDSVTAVFFHFSLSFKLSTNWSMFVCAWRCKSINKNILNFNMSQDYSVHLGVWFHHSWVKLVIWQRNECRLCPFCWRRAWSQRYFKKQTPLPCGLSLVSCSTGTAHVQLSQHWWDIKWDVSLLSHFRYQLWKNSK